ncbi:hypothetical protein ACHAWX_001744 [Stephanocyclus meneghinianus]
MTTNNDNNRPSRSHQAFKVSRWLLTILTLSWAHSSSSSSSSIHHRRNGDGTDKSTFSPVSELGPSLAASIAGGTVIAVRSPRKSSFRRNGADDVCPEDDDCIVLLVRSPDVSSRSLGVAQKAFQDAGASNLTVASVYGSLSGNSQRISRDNDNQSLAEISIAPSSTERERDELRPLFNGPVRHPFLQSSSNNNLRILHAPSGLLVAATGFKPDIDHLMHVAAGKVLARTAIYDATLGSSGRSGKSIDPHRLVREDLSSIIMEEALASDGARPFGVQLLVIGQSTQANHLEIYTIDPSGGWRSHVGWGTAVGRGADRVRDSFSKRRSDKLDTREGAESPGWKSALDRAIMAAVRAFESDGENVLHSDIDSKSRLYGAVVIFCPGSGANEKGLSYYRRYTRCAAVHPDIVEISYTRCLQQLCKK